MTRLLDPLATPYAGAFVDGVHHFAVRVYYEDTDASGIVYHASYLRFMERARSDMLRAAGIDQRAAIDMGEGYYAVAEMQIAFRRPARLDDALLVESRVLAARAAACQIGQRIRRGGDIIADAEVTAAWLGMDGRPKRQPRAWRERFEKLAIEGTSGE